MELVLLGLVAVAVAAFFFWPKVSVKSMTSKKTWMKLAKQSKKSLKKSLKMLKDAVKEALDNLPTKAQLMKLTKAKIDELAKEVGIELDRRQTKEKMVAELQKQAKKAKQ
jgi:hypothetical protein